VTLTRTRAWRRAGLTMLLFLAADQATKQLVVHSVDRGDKINIFFGVDLTNVRNNGVAFGVLSGGGALITVLTLVALSALVTYFAMRATTPWLWLPVGVIVGGALGNLLDRAREGAVIDFIDPAFWPAFNLADTGIVIGILGLLYVIETRHAKKAEAKS
jgi:signal peptidase II